MNDTLEISAPTFPVIEIDLVERKQQELALQVQTDVVEFTETEKGLISLHQRLHGIAYENLATVRGMGQAIADRAELRDIRVGLGKRAKQLNTADREAYETRRDARLAGAEKLQAFALTLETPIDEQIKAEEQRKAVARAEREAAEKKRTGMHEANLELIRNYVTMATGKSAEQIGRGLQRLDEIVIGDDWEEYADQARNTVAATRQTLTEMLHATTKAEADARELALARAEQARIAAEQAAEAERLAQVAADLKRQEEAIQAERARQDAERAATVAVLTVMADLATPAPAAIDLSDGLPDSLSVGTVSALPPPAFTDSPDFGVVAIDAHAPAVAAAIENESADSLPADEESPLPVPAFVEELFWTNVYDELPNAHENVLLAVEGMETCEGYLANVSSDGAPIWFDAADLELSSFLVHAWTPMPKGPQRKRQLET